MPESSEQIILRPARDDDFEWLFSLRRTGMKGYFEASGGWDEPAQRERFRGHFADLSSIRVIVFHGEDVGYLAVDDLGDSLFIGFIGFLPQHQRKGMGTRLLQQVIAEADRRQIPVRLRVLKVNPARTLYERFGFVVIDSEGVRHEMERLPRPTLREVS